MARYLMQAVSSVDGTMKSWLASTRDFAAAGFPGPGVGQNPAVVKAIRDDVMTSTGNGSEEGQRIQWNGSIWIKERGFITPDVDYSGSVDATDYCIALFSRVRQGACIRFADGIVKLKYKNTTDHMFKDATASPGTDRFLGILPQGVTVCGSPMDWRQPYTIFNNGYPDSGTLLKVYASTGNAAVAHAGELFRAGVNTSVREFMVDYADQTHNPTSQVVGAAGSFTPYGTTLHAVKDYHGVTFERIVAHNAYNFLTWECNGGSVAHLKGYPLLRGVTFPRCGAAPNMMDIQFNAVGDYRDNASVAAWVKANGIAFLLDGVEGLRAYNCNAQNYANAVYVTDADGDNFTGIYADWYGPDFEGCTTVIRIDNLSRTYCALGMGGLTFHGGSMVAEVGGYVLDCADTAVPATSPAQSEFPNRPLVEFHGTKFWSGNGLATRNVWIRSGSYAHVKMLGGNAHNFANEHLCRMDSANGYFSAHDVTTPAGVTRTSNGGGGTVRDVDYFSQTIVGHVGGYVKDGSAFADPLQEWFGDGSDGDLTISSGTTTIGGIRNYRNVTITGTGQLDCSAYHVFISGTLDLTNAPANAIVGLANAGGNAVGVTPGAAGAAKTAGTMGASGAGTIGIAGTTGAGAQATAPTNQAPSNGGAGGDGGSGGNKAGGSGGGAARTGATVASSYNPRGPSSYILRGATLVAGGAGAAGGSSGEGDGTNAAGSGAGGGSGAQWVALWARFLKRDTTTAAGCIALIGGLGGNGSNAAAGTAGGGGAGGGGGGGAGRIVAGELLGNQKAGAIVATGGAGGVGGNGSTTGAGGKGGSGGAGGTVLVGELKSNTWTLTTGSAGSAGGAASGATGGTSGAGGACTAAL